ncbi:GPALPP motifs-containing protein 1 [Pangasianodon hypophthalmus]|uniref:GPALPP motifs-containing protein 1 n=1 Tax=Pangasianodon hypophthalmus TaxID=310915 RepID=UPI002307F1D4|nr:GPALPP motifs-containing protein 1 [Pangasianodon hypophthalmus]
MSSDNIIGPALPPGLRASRSDESDEDNTIIGPALPPLYKRTESSSSSSDQEQVVFKRAKYSGSGDSLPSKKRAAAGRCDDDDDDGDADAVDEDDGFFGPALPPGYQKQDSSPERPPVLGPALPPGFKRKHHDDEDEEEDEGRGVLGPALPPGYKAESSSSEGEDEDVIGPMPSRGESQSNVALDFERRAQRMKDRLLGRDDESEKPQRESWMTELPPELQHVGLEARTFKKRSGPENKDRSIWTDTPADRERKARERQEAKERGETVKDDGPRLSKKDLEMAEKVSKYNESKRGESLLSMHAKKMKRKAEEDSKKPAERRPFDRDADLQVNRFDEAQKKALLKKSQELNTRFSHSKDRMFL